MEIRVRALLSALLVVACIGATLTVSIAHPPWNPYDQTRFSPITSFGPRVGIEVVVRGLGLDPETGEVIGTPLTSPLKVVTAPGLPGHIFVVDQVGQLWAVRLSDNNRTLYHDVSARLVTLGVCGPSRSTSGVSSASPSIRTSTAQEPAEVSSTPTRPSDETRAWPRS